MFTLTGFTGGMAIYPHEHRMWATIGLYGGARTTPSTAAARRA
jgi:predicted metal-dependent enzyme (double-stranded beta helix superfamily)